MAIWENKRRSSRRNDDYLTVFCKDCGFPLENHSEPCLEHGSQLSLGLVGPLLPLMKNGVRPDHLLTGPCTIHVDGLSRFVEAAAAFSSPSREDGLDVFTLMVSFESARELNRLARLCSGLGRKGSADAEFSLTILT